MLIYTSPQINLPDSVTKRFDHSMSTYYISKERFWIVVTGGYSEYYRSNNAAQIITGSDAMMIIELGMIIYIHISCDILLLVIIIMFTGMYIQSMTYKIIKCYSLKLY